MTNEMIDSTWDNVVYVLELKILRINIDSMGVLQEMYSEKFWYFSTAKVNIIGTNVVSNYDYTRYIVQRMVHVL